MNFGPKRPDHARRKLQGRFCLGRFARLFFLSYSFLVLFFSCLILFLFVCKRKDALPSFPYFSYEMACDYFDGCEHSFCSIQTCSFKKKGFFFFFFFFFRFCPHPFFFFPHPPPPSPISWPTSPKPFMSVIVLLILLPTFSLMKLLGQSKKIPRNCR